MYIVGTYDTVHCVQSTQNMVYETSFEIRLFHLLLKWLYFIKVGPQM